MLLIGPATEHEMVLAFLKAEIDSPRYEHVYRQKISALGFSRTQLIESADPHNDHQNMERIKLLGEVRGYGANSFLFHDFPHDVSWQRVRLEQPEIARLKYAKHHTWIILSNRTRLVSDGASNIDKIQVADVNGTINENVKKVVAGIQNGKSYSELITVSGFDDDLILIEGHTRATAYVLSKYTQPVTLLVGTSARMRNWAFY
jgi:hypothetical protein